MINEFPGMHVFILGKHAFLQTKRLLWSPITFALADIAHGKYTFQKQLLKFIFQGVESACLSLIQFSLRALLEWS